MCISSSGSLSAFVCDSWQQLNRFLRNFIPCFMTIQFWSQLLRRQSQFARASAPDRTVTPAQSVHIFGGSSTTLNSGALYIRVYVFLPPMTRRRRGASLRQQHASHRTTFESPTRSSGSNSLASAVRNSLALFHKLRNTTTGSICRTAAVDSFA